MTFEERLDRLTERHEAVAPSIVLLRDSIHDTRDLVDRLGRQSERSQQEMSDLRKLMGETGQFINTLARIAENHEHRIERLEEGNEK